MKFISILVLLLVNIQCSPLELTKKFKDVHSEVKPYLDELVLQGPMNKNRLKNLTIGLEEIDEGDTIGFCNYITQEITIKKSWWDNSTHLGKMEVLWHEIGHCILNRPHTNPKNDFWHDIIFKLGISEETGYLRDRCPASIMHPYHIGFYCFNKHYDYYLEELFGRIKKDDYNVKPWDSDGYIQISR